MFPREENPRSGGSIVPATLAAVVVGLLAVAALLPGVALANTEAIISDSDPHAPVELSGWQAGTCSKEKVDTGKYCSVVTPDQFFERSAAHPNYGFTQFIVRHTEGPKIGPLPPTQTPVGDLAKVRVDLPVGLSVNPSATERCSQAQFDANACPLGSKVGESEVTVSVAGLVVEPIPGVTAVPVYNVEPLPGKAARFGLMLSGKPVYLEGDVAWASDYHEGFTIDVPEALPVPAGNGVVLKNRLTFNGRAGDGTFLTTPSTCLGEAFKQSGSIYSTYLLAASRAELAQPGYTFPASANPHLESPIPPGTSPKECNTIPYKPGLAVAPGTPKTNSPAPASVTVTVPHITGGGNQDSSVTRAATVTLPLGMGINPAAAAGLQTCTDAQFPRHSTAPISCPAASKIGTVKIESPPLPDPGNQLVGNVYVGKQLSRDPSSGDEYRIFIDAASARYGVDVRLLGKVRPNPVTGQLATTIEEVPQLPFTSFVLNFDGVPRPAVLSSPGACGPNIGAASMVPWSGNPPATPSGGFNLTTGAAGGACPKTLAQRPFGPSFALAPKDRTAGAFSPLSLNIARPDGQQELKAAESTLAPGLTGKLAGIPYCKGSQLAAAAAKAGTEEAADPTCPDKSEVGTVAIEAGTGPTPLKIAGSAYLTGPYKGAPLSLAVITPAVAGPFDLGTVVVRIALFVDPITAQIHAVSDPIPDVYGGTQLSVRAVRLNLNRKEFTLNGTSCDPTASGGALRGGGADPTNPAAWSSFAVNAPFQSSGCEALKFRPKLTTRLVGSRKKMRRNGHPKLVARMTARPGDANIARAALLLPHSQFLDQAHIQTICTRPKLAAGDCPKGSVYGHAEATTPLLDEKLAGPVYLVAAPEHELPDLVADLQGQVTIQLHGVISAKKARMRTVFQPIPDVPVSTFTLRMMGGKKGLLVNSRNLCGHKNTSFLNFGAQNGKKRKVKRLPLRTPACHSRAKKHGNGAKKGKKSSPKGHRNLATERG